jgi:peptide/nickel transport system ATP-binding protein/oligopeptide transport system ATP-binding protein
MSRLLEVNGLTKRFVAQSNWYGRPLSHVSAVDDVSFTLDAGETLGLVGESGCGKSTTGRLVLRLIEPSAGSIRYDGRDITGIGGAALRDLRREMQLVFQDPYASLNPRMTIGDILAEPLMLHGLVPPAKRKERVAELLQMVGLAPFHARRYPHEFSGGQRQRIGIARALAVEPNLIVADEAVSALDVSVQAQVLNLLKDLQFRLNIALIFIAHDLAVVRHIADRIAVMYLGRIVEMAPTRALFATPRHPYTRALLSAIPVPQPQVIRQREILAGDVPSPIDPPSGCRFHTRCPFVIDRCRQETPAMQPAGGGQEVACHRWAELPAAAPLPATAAGAGADRLARLQARFVQKGAPAEVSPSSR